MAPWFGCEKNTEARHLCRQSHARGHGQNSVVDLSRRLSGVALQKVAVLTRGYAGFGNAAAPSSENDEALLLKKRCPSVVLGAGADRWQSAQRILASAAADVFLLDDGFQHWPLKRDLDLVCIDATDPWGGGWLLPAGRLREPRSALRRASAVVVNRIELIAEDRRRALLDEIESCAVGIPTFVSMSEFHLLECASGGFAPLEMLVGRHVIALSAIGNPRAFEQTLARLGAQVQPVRFADHHAYTGAQLQHVLEQANKKNAAIVITEKDWVKIETLPVNKAHLFVLRMSLSFSLDQQHRLHALIDGVFS